jgi:Ceramidase
MDTNRAPLFTAAAGLAVLAFFIFVPPIAQDQTYHFFADIRTVWGIPNFWNVVSNLPFAAVGILGLWKLHTSFDRVLFTGVLLTFFGSSYYHLAPSDSRLVWDRLPMTLVFMALLACVVSGEKDSRSTRWLLVLLAACGVASVLWWSIANDLRPYVLVQFGPLLILIPALWFVRDARYLSAVLGFYALAKAAEFWDRAIFSGLPISGHSIKHVMAAIATYFILRWRLAAAEKASGASVAHQPAEAALR